VPELAQSRIAGELQQGIAQMGIALGEEAQEKLQSYLTLLHKWNRTYNLTAIRDPQQMVSHHLLDSLAVLPHLWEGRWLDVGCGAGLPGLVLAVAKPEWQFTLLDSSSKKIGFVRQAVIELDIQNVSVYCERLEEWRTTEKFDGIISRAFSELGKFLRSSSKFLAPDGRWVAMKGIPLQEGVMLPEGCKLERVVPLRIPGLSAARSLVIVSCSPSQPLNI